jgi:hypothetical protein
MSILLLKRQQMSAPRHVLLAAPRTRVLPDG